MTNRMGQEFSEVGGSVQTDSGSLRFGDVGTSDEGKTKKEIAGGRISAHRQFIKQAKKRKYTKEDETMITCPKCYNELEDDMKFCDRCGASVDEIPDSQKPTAPVEEVIEEAPAEEIPQEVPAVETPVAEALAEEKPAEKMAAFASVLEKLNKNKEIKRKEEEERKAIKKKIKRNDMSL